MTGYPTDYPAAAAPVPYASWIQRVGAYVVDVLPIWILEIIGASIGHASVSLLIFLISIVYSGYNRWYLGGTTGQSFGKRALNLRLISEQTGQPIGPLMAFVRDICHFLDVITCFVGFLFPLWDVKRQTFADKIVGTVVIPA